MTTLGCYPLDLPAGFDALGAYAHFKDYECLTIHQDMGTYGQSLSPRRLREYHAGRSLARQLLAAKVKGSIIADWHLSASNGRKPDVLYKDVLMTAVDVSITHSKDIVAVVVSDRHHVGIDTEPAGRMIKRSIWSRFLAPAEVEWLQTLDPDEVHLRVRELWCMKEAVSKVSGLGLAVPFPTIVFSRSNDKWEFEKLPQYEAFSGEWQVPCLRLTDEHLFAVCAHGQLSA